jgi:uncharacterized caspase-like protein
MKKAATGLYDDVQVTYALNDQATKAGLEAIVASLATEIQPRDTFILFAASHGFSENGRFYLIPQDYVGAPAGLATRAIGQDEIQEWVANRIRARKVLILLDTCESGALISGYLQSRIDTSASPAGIGRLHEATGRPVLTATAAGKSARGYKSHGVFTYAVLDALRNGDTNGNGTIELSELAAHVQALVPRISAELGGPGHATGRVAPFVDEAFSQSARFGSRGEDFVVARKVQ